MATDRLSATVERLPAGWHGHYLEVVESTQDAARAAARQGAPTRSIFVADCQTVGRGRHGRTWTAAPGSALLMSILFRETALTPRPFRYTSLTSVALVDAIDYVLPRVAVAIKWPNDVMLAERKVAGILAETAWNGDELQVVVGIGVNVSESPNLPRATSLDAHAQTPVDRSDLLLHFVRSLDSHLVEPEDSVWAVWQSRLWRRGQRLTMLDSGREHDVLILGAAMDGSLHVRLASGLELHTTTAELLA